MYGFEDFPVEEYKGYMIFVNRQVNDFTGEPIKGGIYRYFAVNVSNPNRPEGTYVDAGASNLSLGDIQMRIRNDFTGLSYMGVVHRTKPHIRLEYIELLKEYRANKVA